MVRPAWALSCGCKSRRKETILIEAKPQLRKDYLVRDPDTCIGGTEIVRVTVSGSNVTLDARSRCEKTPVPSHARKTSGERSPSSKHATAPTTKCETRSIYQTSFAFRRR
jgi:hypothetical protein